jgi:hypothetical protein
MHRKLDRNSSFVQRTWQLLNDQLQSQDQMRLDSASFFKRDAKTPLEKEIANALEVAFAQ